MQEIDKHARLVAEVMQDKLPSEMHCEVTESQCQVGSGSLPDHYLASRAVCIASPSGSVLNALHLDLRALPTPVISRVQGERLWMDMRTVTDVGKLIENLQFLNSIPDVPTP